MPGVLPFCQARFGIARRVTAYDYLQLAAWPGLHVRVRRRRSTAIWGITSPAPDRKGRLLLIAAAVFGGGDGDGDGNGGWDRNQNRNRSNQIKHGTVLSPKAAESVIPVPEEQIYVCLCLHVPKQTGAVHSYQIARYTISLFTRGQPDTIWEL